MVRKASTRRGKSPPATLMKNVGSFAKAWEASATARHKPAGLLYHYCDANALLSIFKFKRLWASGTRYMNDRTELVSMLRNLRVHAKRHGGTPAGLELAKLAETMQHFGADLLSNAIGMESHAACFSEDGDLLSQWRAYADDGRGFAIGFDVNELKVIASGPKDAELKRMTYGGSDEDGLLDALFHGLIPLVAPYLDAAAPDGWKDGAVTRDWVSLCLGECITALAFESKHPAFAEEREWRIYAHRGETLYRASAGKLVPYRELDMTSRRNPKLMPIRRIVMGPRLDRLDTERVLTYIADSYGYGHAGIDFVASTAPYR